MKIYHISNEYINYLKSFDPIVADNKNEKRPYIGTVIEINGNNYYAPFTSPKAKHQKMKNSLDFRKIDNGKLGAINLNNMIPVADNAVIPVNFNDVQDPAYKNLLQKQYVAINKDCKAIERTAKKLYDILTIPEENLTDQERKIKLRCCNIKLLEEKSKEFLLRRQNIVKKTSFSDRLQKYQDKSKKLDQERKEARRDIGANQVSMNPMNKISKKEESL